MLRVFDAAAEHRPCASCINVQGLDEITGVIEKCAATECRIIAKILRCEMRKTKSERHHTKLADRLICQHLPDHSSLRMPRKHERFGEHAVAGFRDGYQFFHIVEI